MNGNASKNSSVRTRRAVIDLLKQQGAVDAKSLSAQLGVSAMAVRQHLYALQKEKLVTFEEEAGETGRPAKLWRLTPAADRLFPDGYADLTLSLINSVKEAFGEAGLEKLLTVRAKQQIDAYEFSIPQEAFLEERLNILAHLRTEEGYMAEIQSLEDGSFLLVENHCPICAAATACTGLCAKELEIFQHVLGADAIIERTEHIISGERRCVYQVSAQLDYEAQ